MKNIWLDAIMGVVIGDALGLPVQFMFREEIAKNPVKEMRGYGAFDVPPGSWSDDSSLTIATLDSIREKGTIDYTDIMEKFSAWLEHGAYTPFGYAYDVGGTCLKAIGSYMYKKDVETCGQTSDRSNGNGSLMRIMPVCLYAYLKHEKGEITWKDAMAYVHKVSGLTHNHARSRMACGIYFFIVQAILDNDGSLLERIQLGVDNAKNYYNADLMNMLEWSRFERLTNLKEFATLPNEEIESSGYVVDSLEAAIWSLITTDSFEEGLLAAVNLGDDADTVGAIAGGLAGLYYGYDSVPEEWKKVIIKVDEIVALCEMAKEELEVR